MIIHTPTKEEFIRVVKYYLDRGVYWFNKEKVIFEDRWNTYREETCVNDNSGEYLTYSDKRWYEEQYKNQFICNSSIIPYSSTSATTSSTSSGMSEYTYYPCTFNPYTNSSSCSGEKPNKPSIKKMLNNFMKKLLDKETQILIKAEYINGDLLPTQKGKEALDSIVFEANKATLVKMAEEELAEKDKK